MNVIVANKYQAMLSQLDIDIIKTMSGEFSVDELIDTFSNFFFNRMVLDITAIKDYKNIETIQKLSVNLDMTKVILVLDESEESASAEYLSKLISLGIYNFSRNIETIKYLIQNPNSYKDVAHIHQLQDINQKINGSAEFDGVRILGVKNITDHAGATSLIYMMKKELQKQCKVLALEINKRDFSLFCVENMISTSSEQYAVELLKAKEYNVVLVDLNEADVEDTCTDVIYLIEPSTIKLNRMIRRNRSIFDRLKGNKIVLNKSLLDNKDVLDFEYESKSQIFYNLPPLSDKKEVIVEINDLLAKLGFATPTTNDLKEESNKGLGIFKL